MNAKTWTLSGALAISAALALFAAGTLPGAPRAAGQAPALDAANLPPYLKVELRRLQQTWDVLDKCAAGVWPGWTTYRDVPFLITYANGVRLLVGHPDPMDGFTPVPGAEIAGKPVLLDRTKEVAVPMTLPVTGGGGVLRLGKTKPVQTVDLSLAPAAPKRPEGVPDYYRLPWELTTSSDNQVLINVHELFHCFQRQFDRTVYGNLQMNPVLDYAVWSEVEGSALERAFLSTDPAAARDALLDFLAARGLKRKSSMTEQEGLQESEDEVGEGTATYSEARVAEQLKAGYSSNLPGAAEDPFFRGFKDAGAFLDAKLEMLRANRAETLQAHSRCYSFGCFEALLLTRLFPGWQAGFLESGKFLDTMIREKLAPTEAELAVATGRLDARYDVAALRAKHEPVLRARDEAYAMVKARQGRVFVLNLKPTGEFPTPEGGAKSYDVGLMKIYPAGFGRIRVRDVEIEGTASPIVLDQLYHVRWVDVEAKPGEKRYELTYAAKEGEDVYVDAVFKTAGFTLKAPRIRVKDTPQRVKVTVLSKIKGQFPPSF